MCRHLGYLGPPVAVGDLVTTGDHSLFAQSWAPRDMRCAAVANADGWGVGWWPITDGDAVSHRSAMPIWTDPAVSGVMSQVRSGAVIGAVRSATVGMPVVDTAAAPFVDGRWAFSHNGVVTGWPGSLADLAADVPVADLLRLEAPTDSAGLWAIVRHRLRNPDTDPGQVLAGVVADLDTAAPDSRLNLLLGDGTTIWATAVHHSLAVRTDGERTVVASEPLDHGDDWRAVPDRSLVTVTATTVSLAPL